MFVKIKDDNDLVITESPREEMIKTKTGKVLDKVLSSKIREFQLRKGFYYSKRISSVLKDQMKKVEKISQASSSPKQVGRSLGLLSSVQKISAGLFGDALRSVANEDHSKAHQLSLAVLVGFSPTQAGKNSETPVRILPDKE